MTTTFKSVEEKLIESAKRLGAAEPRALTTGDLCGLADHYRELARLAQAASNSARENKMVANAIAMENAGFMFSFLETDINNIVGGILAQRARYFQYPADADLAKILVEQHWLAKVLAAVAGKIAYLRANGAYRIETLDDTEQALAAANALDWMQQEAGKLAYFVGRFTNDAAIVTAEVAKTLFDHNDN